MNESIVYFIKLAATREAELEAYRRRFRVKPAMTARGSENGGCYSASNVAQQQAKR
jgi:hypothetical protein